MNSEASPWIVAVLMGSPMPVASVERLFGYSVARRECRHDLPVRPDHSLVCRREDLTVSVDIFDQKWQDTCGEDTGPNSPIYSHTTAREHLISEPWALHRAIHQYRGEDNAAALAGSHWAYLLLRMPTAPRSDELVCYRSLMELAAELMGNAADPCFFNPRAEVLGGLERLKKAMQGCAEDEMAPVQMLTNARMFELGNNWCLADSVGLAQVGLSDHEVIYNRHRLALEEALAFVRNLAQHLLRHQTHIRQGDTAGGPGETIWEALPLGQATLAPQRRVVRWLPEDREGMPASLEIP